MSVIVLTGGGSSGHVTPNIALIPRLKEKGFTVHYIGSKNGIERPLIEKEGIPYYPINAGKLRRYFDLKNITDVFKVMDGVRQSVSILKKLKPDVVFSKGGFVSCPVVWAAWLCRIPAVIHESDMTPGLTNKLSMPFANKICFTFPESAAHLPQKKGILTGIPIRDSLLAGDRDKGRKICGFTAQKPVLMIIGGSLGSENINKAVRNILPSLLSNFQICHICGKGNVRDDFNGIPGYVQFEYVNEEQPHIFAMADLAISRAGATTLFELIALQKPNLLIPLSKNASRGDQILNAESFAKQGFSKILSEEELTDKTLLNSIDEVYKNSGKYRSAMEKRGSLTAADRIVNALLDTMNGGKNA